MPTRIDHTVPPRLADPLIQAWRQVPTAVAADQLAGAAHVDPGIRPLRPFRRGSCVVGHAVTAWCEPADYGAVHYAIDVAIPGDIIAVAAEGRSDAAMIGELLSTAARRKGIAGVIVDGAVRDAAALAEWDDFPVFARWVTPRGPSTMERGIVNGTIQFGGVPVSPNDLVIGDGDGLVIVPRAAAESKLKPCLARVEAEVEWLAQLARGESTIDVFNVPAGEKS